MERSKLIIQIILAFLSIPSISQVDSIKRINPANITTQRENERYWAQEIFDKKYETQRFEKYKGTITALSSKYFSYDGNIIIAGLIEEDYKIVFEKGIIYPAIFAGFNDGRVFKVEKKPDSVYKDLSYILSRNDSLGVGIMEELKFLNPSVKVKRYSLYLSRPNFMNPSMYVFELTNDNATSITDLKTFLIGAKLTFLKFVSILI